MLTKSVKSVISVVLKHVAWAKKSVQSVRSASYNIRMVLPDSSLCQNGKQVEIITKMIFELCYIEAIIFEKPCHDCFLSFCLHSALFTCTALIINALHSVDKSVFHLHATCTRQQFLYTCLHLLALLSALLTLYLHLLALAFTLSALTCTHWHFVYMRLHICLLA